ncbi:hypothetical protein CDAR_244331 [Caerostris darwini]|uniref:Uncharacterized protein n=1 Tax=Caerostris darwini TaxID=1538125 RepID=A0AAV4RCZ5_9ARAC|nr:hypothetical protein CDAR_244331 [Caerostris darwini]
MECDTTPTMHYPVLFKGVLRSPPAAWLKTKTKSARSSSLEKQRPSVRDISGSDPQCARRKWLLKRRAHRLSLLLTYLSKVQVGGRNAVAQRMALFCLACTLR